MDLALCDFDGTITVDPTYPAFVRFAVHPRRKLFSGIILTPLILGYRIGLLSDHEYGGPFRGSHFGEKIRFDCGDSGQSSRVPLCLL